MPTKISSENPTQSSNKLHLLCNHSHYQCSQFLSNSIHQFVSKREIHNKERKDKIKLSKEMGIHSQNRNWKELNLYTGLASSHL